MPIDERNEKEPTKSPDTDQERELKDLSAKKVDPAGEEKVKGGRKGFGFIAADSEGPSSV